MPMRWSHDVSTSGEENDGHPWVLLQQNGQRIQFVRPPLGAEAGNSQAALRRMYDAITPSTLIRALVSSRATAVHKRAARMSTLSERHRRCLPSCCLTPYRGASSFVRGVWWRPRTWIRTPFRHGAWPWPFPAGSCDGRRTFCSRAWGFLLFRGRIGHFSGKIENFRAFQGGI